MNNLSFGSPTGNDLFRLAFENSPIGMALVGKNGAWLDVNESVCRITGYLREELLSKTFQEITHPDDLEKDLNLLYMMLAGEIEHYEMEKRYFHKQGHVVWTLLTVALVRDKGKKPKFFISQIQDITEEKLLENQLRQRESEMRSILDRGQMIVVRFDPDCRHLYVNSGLENELGIKTENIIGKTISELGIKAKTSDLLESTVKRVFAEKLPVEIEYENLVSRESRCFIAHFSPEFNNQGEIETVLMVSFNVTDLKNTELELRQALAEVKQLQEILPICSYCRSIRDDKDYWHTVENYISTHTDSKFSHSICPHCYDEQIKPQLEILRSKKGI
jgi:PAS domain S-box-containing protein